MLQIYEKNALRLGKFKKVCLSLHSQNTEVVAQSVRASDCGSEGRGFEPHLPPLKIPMQSVGIFCVYRFKKPFLRVFVR